MPQILKHKKFQAGLGMSLLIFLGQFFPAFAETGNALLALAEIDWYVVAGPLGLSTLAQGWADSGKEAAKINKS
jgi:hypothetical protein